MTEAEVLDIALAGNPDAAVLREAMLSPEFAQALQDRIESSPSERRRRDLVVEYGERNGGLALEFLRMFDGAYWGSGLELTLQQCAVVLDVSPDKLEEMYDTMLDEIEPALLKTGAGSASERSRSLFSRKPKSNGAASNRAVRSGAHGVGRSKKRDAG